MYIENRIDILIVHTLHNLLRKSSHKTEFFKRIFLRDPLKNLYENEGFYCNISAICLAAKSCKIGLASPLKNSTVVWSGVCRAKELSPVFG